MIALFTIRRLNYFVIIFLLAYASGPASLTYADKPEKKSEATIFAERMQLYESMSLLTNMRWQWIAAIDQYERTISKARPKTRPKLGNDVGIYLSLIHI